MRIPGVVLEEELGRGASSVVYRGDRRGTPCAIKIGRADHRAARWFRREAVALARIEDRGLPRVMEVGQVDGVPYLVMELVEGETLGARLSRGPLSESDTLDFATRLCRILGAVHRRGLVHRDVKPKNIVLEPTGRVRLVDFGFVTHAYGAVNQAGTQVYAAPEQLHTPAVIDSRANMYALGRVLYECLTGERPVERDLDPEAVLGSGFGIVIAGLVAPEPDDRYRSAAALMEISRAFSSARRRSVPTSRGPRRSLSRSSDVSAR